MSPSKKKLVSENLASLIEKYKEQDVISIMEEEYQKLASFNIPLNQIEDNPFLKSIKYSPNRLLEIQKLLLQRGFVTPLVVRPINNDKYQLILGRKRYLVGKKMNLNQAPVVIKNIDDHEMLLILLAYMRIEGETEALSFATVLAKLKQDYHYKQFDLAVLAHVKRTTVANWIRLLKLPKEVIAAINKGEISSGHGKALLMLPPEEILPALEKIKKDKLSVRQTEYLSQTVAKKKKTSLSPYSTVIEKEGKLITIYFASASDLNVFLKK